MRTGSILERLAGAVLVAALLLPYAKVGPCSAFSHEHTEAHAGHTDHQVASDSPTTAASSCHVSMGCGVVSAGPVQAGPQATRLAERSRGARIVPPSGHALELESPLTPPPKV